MQKPAPALFPIFRSRLTAAVLSRVYIGEAEYSIAELAKAAQTDSGSMAREVRRLESAKVVRSRMVGRTRLVSADKDTPFYRPLRDLVVITLGPAEVLGEELIGVSDISTAAIFGSWAARAAGEAGPSPADIDLLVIGRPNRDDLHEAVGRARARLGRDVNTVVISPDRWSAGDDPFILELDARPMAAVRGIPSPRNLAVMQ